MKKNIIAVISVSALLAGVGFLSPNKQEKVNAVTNYVVSTNGCSYMSSLPTTIYLDEVEKQDIKNYYSSLNNLSQSERQGTNLLKNLRPILFEMNYLKYGGIGSSGGGVSYAYTITDRDWEHSPASSIVGGTYNSSNNTITGYNHKTEIDADPYIHMLYVDYEMQPTTKFKKDASNPNFDKEHVWCQSRGFKGKTDTADGPAGTDMHHLIAGDSQVNQEPHNNNPYGFVDVASLFGNQTFTAANVAGSAEHTSPSDEANIVFEPIDSSKGDIARAIFYMVARYNNYGLHNTISDFEPFLELGNYATSNAKTSVYSTNTESVNMGILSDLLAWNKIDPVDEFEIHRNDLIYRNYQGNRNPFIDYPQWADYIWGTAALDGTNYNPNPTGYADPENDTIYYTGDEDVPVTGVSLDQTSLSVDRYIQSTITLTATVSPANASNKVITWTSSNSDVATVSGGVVTLLKAGNTTITATTASGGFTAICSITVSDTTPVVTSVTLNKTSDEIDVSRANQTQLTATVNGLYNPSSKVNWSTSDSSVATVSDTGLVTAVAPGTATITATSNYDNTKSATCTITVIDSSVGIDEITYSKLGFVSGDSGYKTKTGISDTTTAYYTVHSCKNNNNYIQFNTTSPAGLVSAVSGGSLKKVEVNFNTATSTSGSGRIVKVYGSKTSYSGLTDLYDSSKRGDELGSNTYSTGNEKVTFDVDPDEGYKYVGIIVQNGAAYFDSFKFTWKTDADYVAPTGVSLNSETETIGMNEKVNLTATVSPETASNKGVIWSSSDERVAIVNESGVVTGLAPGTATITVDTLDQHFTDTCVVTVNRNTKYKQSSYVDGVPYKMYLQATGYFNGGTGSSDYFGTTSTDFSNGVDVFFETVGEYKRIYFEDSGVRKYLVAYLNGTYKNFGIKDVSVFTDGTTTLYEWKIDESGHLYATADGVQYTLGLKNGQTFTTFALNAYSATNRFMLFEYTAESFAKDFLDNITCDNRGINAPIYASGYTWNDFSSIYSSMDSTQKSVLKSSEKSETGSTIEQAMSKYEYIAWKYALNDFIERGVTPRSQTSDYVITYSNNIALLVTIAAIITLSTIFVISYRRKHN